jgi:hypothetical protein
MVNIKNVSILIDRIAEIKERFVSESFCLATSYDYKTGQRINSSTQFDTIYKDPVFLDWKEKLLFELLQIKDDAFVSEIIQVLNHFNGFGDKSRFSKLESKLYVLKEHLGEYLTSNSAEVIDDARIPEKEIDEKILRALLKLQRNHHYNASVSEDTMNDYIRDILDETYIVKDQTRQGDSESGKGAGEVDIQICSAGLPVVMIEGIKIKSLEQDRLETHLNKVLTNYDPNGCPYAFLLIYSTVRGFFDHYQKLVAFLKDYAFPYPRETELSDTDTGYAELKHINTILNRNEKMIRMHIYVVHIQ